jgi:hypothetical protein
MGPDWLSSNSLPRLILIVRTPRESDVKKHGFPIFSNLNPRIVPPRIQRRRRSEFRLGEDRHIGAGPRSAHIPHIHIKT